MKVDKEFIIGEKYTFRELQELAVSEMYKSISEHTDKADPKVGAVLSTQDGVLVSTAHRGELRSGDHAEFTVLERKCRDRKLDGYIVFATLEPCAKRNEPKLSCANRIVNARISKVYIGIQDPDPTVSGKGEDILKNSKIEVFYFEKDLQDKIINANKEFLEQARDRARKADSQELQPLKNPFEVGLKPPFSMKDFSEDALQMYIDKAGIDYKIDSEDFYRLLAKWGFIEIDNQQMQPTGWGILLFGKRPTDKYSQAKIKFTVSKGENYRPEIQDFNESLVKIPEQIEKYLNYVFPKAIDRSHFEHAELMEISLRLLRESIINAIVHRDYSIEGAHTLPSDDHGALLRLPFHRESRLFLDQRREGPCAFGPLRDVGVVPLPRQSAARLVQRLVLPRP
jgi:ATP-dependent DNA helicase RecG